MTNNPTIDGVSRCKTCRGSGWIDNLRSVGTQAAKCPDCAPAVERQPAAAWIKVTDKGRGNEYELDWYGAAERLKPGEYELYTETRDVAALQSTIARLEAQLNNAINLDFQRRERITQLESEKEFAAATYQAARDRIADLESGNK